MHGRAVQHVHQLLHPGSCWQSALACGARRAAAAAACLTPPPARALAPACPQVPSPPPPAQGVLVFVIYKQEGLTLEAVAGYNATLRSFVQRLTGGVGFPSIIFEQVEYLGVQAFDPALYPLVVDSRCGAAAGTWAQAVLRVNTPYAFAVRASGAGGRALARGSLARSRWFASTSRTHQPDSCHVVPLRPTGDPEPDHVAGRHRAAAGRRALGFCGRGRDAAQCGRRAGSCTCSRRSSARGRPLTSPSLLRLSPHPAGALERNHGPADAAALLWPQLHLAPIHGCKHTAARAASAEPAAAARAAEPAASSAAGAATQGAVATAAAAVPAAAGAADPAAAGGAKPTAAGATDPAASGSGLAATAGTAGVAAAACGVAPTAGA